MNADWLKLEDEVREQATDWHVRLSSGDATNADYEAFADWLGKDEVHMVAYELVETFSGKLEGLGIDKPDAFDDLMETSRFDGDVIGIVPRMRAHARPVLMGLVAVFVLFASVGLSGLVSLGPEAATYIAERDSSKEIMLADGSTVFLSPGASMDVVLKKRQREVSGLAGIAYFDIASDAQRPFIISAENRQIRVVGTQFEVRVEPNFLSVAVSEGAVSVQDVASTNANAALMLVPGDLYTVSAGVPEGMTTGVDPAKIATWKEGYLEFLDASLATVVSELNLFFAGDVFAAETGGGDEGLFSGILLLSDPLETSRHLSELSGFQVRKDGQKYILSAGPPVD